MKTQPMFFLSALLATAACVPSQGPATFDTGSMALPQSTNAGEFRRAAPAGFDTGSMSLPTVQRPGQAVSTVPGASPDTGSMASPAPRSTGIIPN